jgi:hypothetical protein
LLEAKKEVKKEKEVVAAPAQSTAAPKKKAAAPKKEAAKTMTFSDTTSGSKAKSAFQLELERHMAGAVEEEVAEKKEKTSKKAAK